MKQPPGSSHPPARGTPLLAGAPEVERRRFPRLRLATEQLKLASSGKVFGVHDLSVLGFSLRLIDAEDLFLFPVGAKVAGQLNIHAVKYPIQAAVQHVGRELVGCAFTYLSPEVSARLEQVLGPRAQAAQLRALPLADPNREWYRGVSGTEVLVWRRPDGALKRVVVLSGGACVQWDDDAGVGTAQARADSACLGADWGATWSEQLALTPDTLPDAAKLQIAKALILGSNLPMRLREWARAELGVMA